MYNLRAVPECSGLNPEFFKMNTERRLDRNVNRKWSIFKIVNHLSVKIELFYLFKLQYLPVKFAIQ